MNGESALEGMPRDVFGRLKRRLAGLLVLSGFLALLGSAAVTAVFMMTDAWVAPINLSPDNDAVIQLTLRLNAELAEMARFDAEVVRIEGDLKAVEAAIVRLGELRNTSQKVLSWQARSTSEEEQALSNVVAQLKAQGNLLQKLRKRQEAFTQEARKDLAAGLIDRTELQKQEQALDALRVSLLDNHRLIEEAQLRQKQVAASSVEYRAELSEKATSRIAAERKPELAASDEHDMRVELELLRLESERRSLQSLQRVATERLAKERKILEDIKTRPLYRAVNESTDVAFVPYSQLEVVEQGARVLSCIWGLFFCRNVGTVSEVLPGEVTMQDPWGAMARGQYALLALSDKDAIKEKTLRVRSK